MQQQQTEQTPHHRLSGVLRLVGRRALGVLLLLSVVVIWVSSGNLIQFIFSHEDFDQPFFLTYFSTTLFSVYLLGFLCVPGWRRMPLFHEPTSSTSPYSMEEDTASSENVHQQAAIAVAAKATTMAPTTTTTTTTPASPALPTLTSATPLPLPPPPLPPMPLVQLEDAELETREMTGTRLRSAAYQEPSSNQGQEHDRNQLQQQQQHQQRHSPETGSQEELSARKERLAAAASPENDADLGMDLSAAPTTSSITSEAGTGAGGNLGGRRRPLRGSADAATRLNAGPPKRNGSPRLIRTVAGAAGSDATVSAAAAVAAATMEPVETVSLTDVMRVSIIFCPVWFGANWFYNMSLSRTAISSSTVLSTTSTFWTLFVGAAAGVDAFTMIKFTAVLMCFSGVALVAFIDEEQQGQDSLLGDAFAVLGAIMYALYAVLLKKLIGERQEVMLQDVAPASAAALNLQRPDWMSQEPDALNGQDLQPLSEHQHLLPEHAQSLSAHLHSHRPSQLYPISSSSASFSSSSSSLASSAAAAVTTLLPPVPAAAPAAAAAAAAALAAAPGGPGSQTGGKKPPPIPTPLFFGFVGLFNLLLLAPFLLLLDWLSVEHFRLPNERTVLFLGLNGLIGTVFSDLLWLWGVLLTSPLVATLALSLSTVLAIISDAVLNGKRFSVYYFCGAALVLSAFVLVNLESYVATFLRRCLRRHPSERIQQLAEKRWLLGDAGTPPPTAAAVASPAALLPPTAAAAAAAAAASTTVPATTAAASSAAGAD